MFNEITIIGGVDKSDQPEKISSLTIRKGQIFSIVGFTGSGKSQLITDIEQMAQKDTVTKRQILLDGKPPSTVIRNDPGNKIVAQLSQTMGFILDMQVKDFLMLHAECRNVANIREKADEVIEVTNKLAGEAVNGNDTLTSLSGGQSRALMIADVALISDSPIILIDEIENAGIDRKKAMDLLEKKEKIVLIVTHDPLLALTGEKRIVMKNGGMVDLINLKDDEKILCRKLEDLSSTMLAVQNSIRAGEHINQAF